MAIIDVLDVAHGNAAVVCGPDGVVLIDAGPGRNVLLEYLLQQGITSVDCVVISHADEDHLRGLLAVLGSDSVDVAEVRVNANAIQSSAVWDNVTWSLSRLQGEGALEYCVSVVDGDDLPSVAPGVVLEVLAPDRYLASHGPGWTDGDGRRATTNTLSVVVRVTVDGEPRVLLPGDLDEMGLDYLLANRSPAAKELVFPHHGGNVRPGATVATNEAYAQSLLEAVGPESVLFSLGRGRHGTPRPEIIQQVRATVGEHAHIACTQLSERCRTGTVPPADSFGHLLPQFAAGRAQQRCCGGTMRIALRGQLAPAAAAHLAFKMAEAPTRLCG